MDFKPLFDRVLIKPVTSEENVGGLYIPDTSTNFKKGIVVAAGEGKTSVPKYLIEELESIRVGISEEYSDRLSVVIDELKKPLMAVAVDDTVLYKSGEGTPITLDGEQYLILREADVWMVK